MSDWQDDLLDEIRERVKIDFADDSNNLRIIKVWAEHVFRVSLDYEGAYPPITKSRLVPYMTNKWYTESTVEPISYDTVKEEIKRLIFNRDNRPNIS